MRIKLVAVGKGMPGWVKSGFDEYARRLPPQCRLELSEVRAERRTKNSNTAKVLRVEGERLIAASGSGTLLVALDENGRQWSTPELAARLGEWQQGAGLIALMVGGADGLDPRVVKQSNLVWSLSRLTLPHMLVRIVIAEQIYRAWSIINRHPYHRI
ncbi:MAG: 23S rRNA (pseudouridine(1915)-N(3))-methyltransferase RlmH [Gammaproteobacteria bacterium]|nr:23S rRNA (pseudouridine(1915)-N(3))-methyltransferase RlmH [Gammaproteobacteria bacterium]